MKDLSHFRYELVAVFIPVSTNSWIYSHDASWLLTVFYAVYMSILLAAVSWHYSGSSCWRLGLKPWPGLRLRPNTHICCTLVTGPHHSIEMLSFVCASEKMERVGRKPTKKVFEKSLCTQVPVNSQQDQKKMKTRKKGKDEAERINYTGVRAPGPKNRHPSWPISLPPRIRGGDLRTEQFLEILINLCVTLSPVDAILICTSRAARF